MAGDRPAYPPEFRTKAIALAKQIGASAAARSLGCSKTSVANWARQAGTKLADRTEQTAAACKAQAANAAARRAALSAALLDDAERLRQQLFAPAMVHSFGGKENTYAEHKLNEPTFRDKQAVMTSIAIAVDKHLAITKHDSDGGEALSAVDLWLKHVTGQGDDQ